MKKKYLSPEILIQKIVLQQMIATSNPTVTMKEDDAEIDSEVLSRRHNRNAWEDEEYDDEEDW